MMELWANKQKRMSIYCYEWQQFLDISGMLNVIAAQIANVMTESQ